MSSSEASWMAYATPPLTWLLDSHIDDNNVSNFIHNFII